MKIHVKYKQTVKSEWNDPQGYGWGGDYDFVVEAVSLKRPLVEYETINVAGNIRNGDTVWVLHVVYTESDSFGSARGKGEIIWLFKSHAAALSAQKSIDQCKDNSSLVFADDDGEIIYLSNPADHYCDTIVGVVLTPIVVAEHISYDYAA